MKKSSIPTCLLLIILIITGQPSYAQAVLKKLKEKAKEEVLEEIKGGRKPAREEAATEENQSADPAVNTRGEGLDATPPDVMENIAGAEKSYLGKDYGEARYSVRQAVLGIEMEIGKNILEDLPESVAGLESVKEEDRVSSQSIGFTGLTIERVYRGQDQELKATIANNAMLLSSVNMYLNSATYTTGENQKRIDFQGKRGVLEYDENSGYTLSVPFGQSSIFVLNGINFSNEQEIMSAADVFNLDQISNELGEK